MVPFYTLGVRVRYYTDNIKGTRYRYKGTGDFCFTEHSVYYLSLFIEILPIPYFMRIKFSD